MIFHPSQFSPEQCLIPYLRTCSIHPSFRLDRIHSLTILIVNPRLSEREVSRFTLLFEAIDSLQCMVEILIANFSKCRITLIAQASELLTDLVEMLFVVLFVETHDDFVLRSGGEDIDTLGEDLDAVFALSHLLLLDGVEFGVGGRTHHWSTVTALEEVDVFDEVVWELAWKFRHCE